MKIILNSETPPEWDNVGRVDYDFYGKWGGLYIHYNSTIRPKATEHETKQHVADCCKLIAIYIMRNKSNFSIKDRFQICIGWPVDIRVYRREIVKTGGRWHEIEQLADNGIELKFYPGWSDAIEWREKL